MRRTWPETCIEWAVHPKWADLFVGNPLDVHPIYVDRKDRASLREAFARLRAQQYDFVIDFQGLIQSAFVSRVARRKAVYGFHRSLLREWPAAWFYSHAVSTSEAHVVDRNMALAIAAGARPGPVEFPLPAGRREGELPDRFVLAAPLAGWTSKQWPLDYYAPLARRLREEFGLALVLNGAPNAAAILRSVEGANVHVSGIAGLIDATRRATAAVGLDSGPMHLAAALGKPGVALFGPTDPARNGPYGGSLTVLRHPSAKTTYERGTVIDPSLRALTPEVVAAALAQRLQQSKRVEPEHTGEPPDGQACEQPSARGGAPGEPLR
jgi:heptosyltransferase-1